MGLMAGRNTISCIQMLSPEQYDNNWYCVDPRLIISVMEAGWLIPLSAEVDVINQINYASK